GIYANEESFRATMDQYASIDPLGSGTGELAEWPETPCSSSCNRTNVSGCTVPACIGYRPQGRIRYRYACSTIPASRQHASDFTCAASADLDGNGRSKMFVY